MKTIWVHREIDAPATTVWELFTDPEAWPEWGPSVRSATFATGPFETGSTGSLTTALGIRLPFEITSHDDMSWTWKVAGVTATEHTVRPLGPERCRAGIGVPWLAAPYLAVCRVALRRLEALALANSAEVGRSVAPQNQTESG